MTQNGYYSVTTVGTTFAQTVLTRIAAITAADMVGSYVQAGPLGTANAYTIWYCTNTVTPTFGSTAITFSMTAPANFFVPPGLLFQSFATGWGDTLTATTPDIGSYTWSTSAGAFQVTAFNNGAIAPAVTGARTLSLVNYGSASCTVGITFATPPNLGWYSGLAVLWSSTTSYIRVDQQYIVLRAGSVYTIVATHSTSFNTGDRMVVVCSSGGTVTVYCNGTEVSSYVSGLSGTNFGPIYEQGIFVYGTIQPKCTMGNPRRDKRTTGRGTWQQRKYHTIDFGAGVIQNIATLPSQRRLMRTRRAVTSTGIRR
jgi:hypothetical protein